MKALVIDGIVHQIEEDADVFEVHSDFQWVDCDNSVQENWAYDGTNFTDPFDYVQEAKDEKLRCLIATDWTQSQDSPLSEEERVLWSTYRQAVRDIATTPGYPENIVWPTKPDAPDNV